MNLRQALSLIESGQYSEALRALEPLLADPAQRTEALGHRAWLYRSLGRYEDAIHDYETLLKSKPEDSELHYLRAETLLISGDAQRALEAITTGFAERMDDTRVLDFLRQYHAAKGKSGPPSPSPSQNNANNHWPINPVIAALEQDQNSYPASSFPEIGRFLYSAVRMLRPTLALETGTFIGYSALCIAQAMEDNGEGHLHAFDLFLDLDDYESPLLGPCGDALQVAKAHFEKAGLSHRATFHKGDSAQKIQEDLKARAMEFDFAFIDGDHTIPGCFNDWNAVAPLIKDNGIILLHDIEPRKCGWLGPHDLLEKLNASQPDRFQALRLPSPDGFGLGMIQKQTDSTAKPVSFGLASLAREVFFDPINGRKPGHSLARFLKKWLPK